MTETLRHRLVIETPADLPDGQGGVTRAWLETGAFWGHVSERASDAAFADGRVMTLRRYRVTLRHRALPETFRLRHAGHILTPLPALDRDGRGRWLVLECEEQPEVAA